MRYAIISPLVLTAALYATAALPQAQQQLTIPTPPQTAPPSTEHPIQLPPLRYCIASEMTAGGYNNRDIGCQTREETYCQTGETGDSDDTPSDSQAHHRLSVCIGLGARCISVFDHLCLTPKESK
jgi:hypothetical protein